MNSVNLIVKKRNGIALAADEIRWLIEKYVAGEVPDYQMSAFLMAVYYQGMSSEELSTMTESMIRSGDTIDLAAISGIKVDKHSTGGVGDKVSILLAPLVAAAGIPVPMMSGRGLGHTGGTLDKLEAIPGFHTQLSEPEFIKILKETGYAMIGQTENIVPADRKLYALRDVTGTVPSIPLICSSIISKKKAEGTNALVLDVKTGKGAFLQDRNRTIELAQTLVCLGENVGLRTIALLTNMDQPLGNRVGNWLETREAIDALKGHGPEDLMEVTLALGSVMMVLGEKAKSYAEGNTFLKEKLESGEALALLKKSVKLQHGDASVVDNPDSVSLAPHRIEVVSQSAGFVQSLNAYEIGLLSVDLGAGRQKKEDAVDSGAGLVLQKKIGDPVQKGDVLATCYTAKSGIAEEMIKRTNACYKIGAESVKPAPMVDMMIDKCGIVERVDFGEG